MLGVLIGAAGVLGGLALAMGAHRHRRYAWHAHPAMGWGAWHHGGPGWDQGGCGPGWHHGHRHHGGWSDRGGFGGPWGRDRFERFAREGLRRKLRLREEQEEVLASAVRDIGLALETLVTSVKDSRDDVARAFRGETLDEVRLATVFEGHDEDLARARKDVVAALKAAHAVLDAEQRGKIADLLDSEPVRWV